MQDLFHQGFQYQWGSTFQTLVAYFHEGHTCLNSPRTCSFHRKRCHGKPLDVVKHAITLNGPVERD